MNGNSFKNEHKFEKRVELCTRLRTQYPDRIPVIIDTNDKKSIEINRKKYLTPVDISIAAFLNEIRKQAKIKPEEAIFLFFGNGVLAPTAYTMSQAYDKYKDEDGFLYITVALENTFGADVYNYVISKILDSSSKIATIIF